LLRSAALGIANGSSAEVVAAREEMVRGTHAASPEVRLLEMWLARQ
jgi:hypothetical protein